MAIVIEIGSQRDLFDVPGEVAYFNTANLSPMLRGVREAGAAALERRAQPWRITSDDWFSDVERLRGAYAASSASSPTPSRSSRRRATASRSPRAISTRLPATRSSCSPTSIHRTTTRGALLPADGRRTADRPARQRDTWTQAVLAVLGERTRVVAVPNVHWTDGSLVDLDAVVASARRVGAAVVIDASQSLGAMPLDVLRATAGFRRVGRLQVASRSARCRLPLCRRAPPRRRADRGELDQSRRGGGFRRAGRLRRDIPSGRPALRRGRAYELWARADGARRGRTAPRVDDSRGSRRACER